MPALRAVSMNVKAFSTPWSRHAKVNCAFHGWEGFRNSFPRLRNISLRKSVGGEIAWQGN
jgi:hypothetical protein